eukprot:TRINITY_DN8785_c0_g1_i1.p1 TRINITY_DN8785_c0_g1~~TRINITY_DN8785_c0_g1_i1.p1  ORF type:complete len:210 (+),score=39.46 TRINITY_DN8785_c0_g1_i1:44-673(+)
MSLRSEQLHDPYIDEIYTIQYSLHTCSSLMNRELKLIFPDLSMDLIKQMIAIPTFQPSSVDLVGIGENIEMEKNRLLDNFMKWAEKVVEELKKQGYWADIIDPCTGMPVYSRRGPAIHDDVMSSMRLLRYDVHSVGCCKVILHPTWGSSVYPSFVFAIAPVYAIKCILSNISGSSKLPISSCTTAPPHPLPASSHLPPPKSVCISDSNA